MSIKEHETIWFPGIYGGRTDEEYTQKVGDVLADDIVKLVKKRAFEDGEWTIKNGFVGDNEDKMRKMMEWVSDTDNITQCLEHVDKQGMSMEYTVDWVCRDLANASKWVGGSR